VTFTCPYCAQTGFTRESEVQEHIRRCGAAPRPGQRKKPEGRLREDRNPVPPLPTGGPIGWKP
jgi:hypothetical protein